MKLKEIAARYQHAFGIPSIYFLRSNLGPVKIGLTINLPERIASIESCQPYHFTSGIVVPAAQHQLGRLESIAHQRESARKISGEWFNADLHDLIGTIEEIAKLSHVGYGYIELWRINCPKSGVSIWRYVPVDGCNTPLRCFPTDK